MQLPKGVVLLDSLGDLQVSNSNPILVCGSHCGGNKELAKHVKNCNVKAVFLNNAGVGKNQAGIKGLTFYNAESIIACAVSHNSAEIGISRDTWNSGSISHINTQAQTVGIKIGDSVKEAVAKTITFSKDSSPTQPPKPRITNKLVDSSSKADLKKQTLTQIKGVDITVTDSITFLNENNTSQIVVCGSHGGLSAGDYAQKHKLKAVFFNDAGIGKNNAGVQSLKYLSEAGILACTVDCMSAEIFNGQDVLENGIITVCNQLAINRNIKQKMSVKEAIVLI